MNEAPKSFKYKYQGREYEVPVAFLKEGFEPEDIVDYIREVYLHEYDDDD